MATDDKIKSFLLSFPYHTLHEQDKNKTNIEHFFVGIEKTDIKDAIVANYIKAHIKAFPVKNLSDLSMEYLSYNDENYYILIDSLDKNDKLYKQKAKMVENNAANILAIKWSGEPIDMSAHFIYNAEKYLEDFKSISSEFGQVAKEQIKKNIIKGRKLFEEKKPIIEEKIRRILKK